MAQRPQAVQATSQSSSCSSPASSEAQATQRRWLTGWIEKRSFGQISTQSPHALHLVDDRQRLGVHPDGVEVADDLAVADPQAPPEAPLAAAGDEGCRPAGREPLVAGAVARDVGAAGAGEAGDPLLLGADVDAEVGGDRRPPGVVRDGALARQRLPGDQGLREGATAGVAAGATVGVRQHLLDLVDARVLFDRQLPVREHEERGQNDREAAEGSHGGEYRHARLFPLRPDRSGTASA